jgi:molecular chaperone DnaK (HSP70)
VLELGRGFSQVKAVNGDPRLGGDDYDNRLARRLAEAFALAPDGPSAEGLRSAAQETKIALSTSDRVLARAPG